MHFLLQLIVLPSRRAAIYYFDWHTLAQPDLLETTADMLSSLEQENDAISCAAIVSAYEIVYLLLRWTEVAVQQAAPSAARANSRLRLLIITGCAIALGVTGIIFLVLGMQHHHVDYLLCCKGIFVLSIWVFEVRREPDIVTCATNNLSSLRHFPFCN